MNAYFQNPSRQSLLFLMAYQWIGTRFVPHGRILGAGVDCVNLVAQIFLETGFLDDFEPPRYSIQEGKHIAQSKLTAWLEDSGRFARLAPATEPEIGDVLCFRFRQRVAHHVGLKLRGQKFIHVLERRTVEIASLSDRTYSRALQSIYRPIESGEYPLTATNAISVKQNNERHHD